MSYIYEEIKHITAVAINVFIASINHSNYHWHNDYEVMLVLDGSVRLSCKNQTTLCSAGDIALVNSQEVHELIGEGQDNLCLFVQIDRQLMSYPSHPDAQYYFYLNSASESYEPKEGYAVFRHTLAEIGLFAKKEDPGSRHLLQANLHLFLAELYKNCIYDVHPNSNVAVDQEDLKLLTLVLEYVQLHFSSKNIHQDICEDLGVSDKTLYRFLKKYLGFSLKDLVLKNRIDHAKYLLKFEDRPIGYIVSACGFGSDKSFYRAFKKEVGMTPATFKQSDKIIEKTSSVKNYFSTDLGKAMRLLREWD